MGGGGGGFILGGGGWQLVYFGRWWLVVGNSGWWWMVVDGGTVYKNPAVFILQETKDSNLFDKNCSQENVKCHIQHEES